MACGFRWRLTASLRSFADRHSGVRYAQILPVGLLLWGLDAVDRFRAGAALTGLRNALVVVAISRHLGGAVADSMNDWLAVHPVASVAAAWFYVALQSTVTAAVGVLLIWRRAPTFGLHRNALIACNVIGLVVFWLYPVAPPRMLPGYHDVTAAAVPLFSGVLESKAADQFASLPSLHVAWSLWVAVACGALLRRPVLRAAAWLYPAATAVDVLATANHYMLDVVTAPGVVLLAYTIALLPRFARRLGLIPGSGFGGGGFGSGGPLAGYGRGAAGEQHDSGSHDGERRHLGDHVPWPAREVLVQPEGPDADRYQRCAGGDHGKHWRDKGF
jgi:hypothetical protein